MRSSSCRAIWAVSYTHLAAKGRLATTGRGPDHGVIWCGVWKCPIEIGQKDQRLWLDSMLIEPVEAGTELCAAATDWIEVKHLAGRVGINLLNLGVEVENVHPLGDVYKRQLYRWSSAA